MKRIFVTIVFVSTLLLPDFAHAQSTAYGGTGKLGFGLNIYGRVRIYTPTSDGITQMDRAAVAAALDSAHVFDYKQDATAVSGATLTTGGMADTILTVLTSNGSGPAPNVQARTTIYAWHNDDFFIVKFTIINTSSATYPLYLGIGVVAEPSGTYGLETVSYDASKKVAYFFRSSEQPYVGVKMLGQLPYSFHVRDWNNYSTNTSSEVATDSTRWLLMSTPGFDGSLTGGADGTFFYFNAGLRTIAAGDSSSFMTAFIYNTSEAAMLADCDSADARYARVFTSVEDLSRSVPEKFALSQNFPNPFNPSTRIEFQLKQASQTTLKVYDVLGREVAVLVNEHLGAGSYGATFDARNLSSGIYYYRLVAGSFSDSKRMLLVK